jgi:Lytic transglycolase/Putative peptidoglycan binding domain
MDDFSERRTAQNTNPSRHRSRSTLSERPDRIALWAVVMAVVAMVAGLVSAHASASSGGIDGNGGTGAGGGPGATRDETTAGCPDTELGKRRLEVGDCGADVETLNWILKAKRYGHPRLVDDFDGSTEGAVRAFQSDAALSSDGVVDKATSEAIVNSMPAQLATWYGPGLFGNNTACGQTLKPQTLGVAHKTLPCGSKVVLRYKGRYVRTKVIDRGPFANGAKWDLTQATAEALHFDSVGTGDVRVAKLAKGA